jgi:hypothetical protein
MLLDRAYLGVCPMIELLTKIGIGLLVRLGVKGAMAGSAGAAGVSSGVATPIIVGVGVTLIAYRVLRRFVSK